MTQLLNDTKVCLGCGLRKSLTDFHAHPGTKDGRNSQCKECRRAYARARHKTKREELNAQSLKYYYAHKEDRKQKQAAWRNANRDHIRKYDQMRAEKDPEEKARLAKVWREKDPDNQRFAHLKNRYGLTREHWRALWDNQNGRCAVCSEAMIVTPYQSLSVNVDHCHECGKVRGMVHQRCKLFGACDIE